MSESDVYRRQILTANVHPRAEINIDSTNNILNHIGWIIHFLEKNIIKNHNQLVP